MIPVFVSPEGAVLNANTIPTPSEVETPEEPLHLVAAREAQRQSTNKPK